MLNRPLTLVDPDGYAEQPGNQAASANRSNGSSTGGFDVMGQVAGAGSNRQEMGRSLDNVKEGDEGDWAGTEVVLDALINGDDVNGAMISNLEVADVAHLESELGPAPGAGVSAKGGEIIIHSYEGDGGSLSGHSWIEYQKNGTTTTYGTYGNNNGAQGVKGLNINTELNYPKGETRGAHIDADQEVKMMNTIDRYKSMGEAAWTYPNPCSSFACNVWYSATGENLNSRNWFGVSNPQTLSESIARRNVRDSRR